MDAVHGWLVDPATGEARPRVMVLVGLGIFAMGAFLLVRSVDAYMGGSQYVGSMGRRSFGNRMPSDFAVPISAFVTLCGAMYLGVGVSQAFPRLARHEWLKKVAGWIVLIALVLIVLATCGVVAARILT
jgi:LPXTG-motif cell wall-anchored protein